MRSPDFIRERARTLRRSMTGPERTLWAMIRRGQLGLHFRRQHPIGPFVLDFYAAAVKLGVEIDGPVHEDRRKQDERRTAWLTKQGIQVLRFSVDDVEARPAMVIKAIQQAGRAARQV